MTHHMNPIIALIVTTLAISCAHSKPADKLYAIFNDTLLKIEPVFSSDTLETLDKDHELTEIFRQGSWILVAIDAKTTGWVLAAETSTEQTSTSSESAEPPTESVPKGESQTPKKTSLPDSTTEFLASLYDNSERPKTPEFKRFETAVWKLHHNFTDNGYVAYTNIKYLGDGIVKIMATDFWLGVPIDLRIGNLQTFYDLWEAADGTGLPIAIYIHDQHDRRRMSKSMKRGGVKTY